MPRSSGTYLFKWRPLLALERQPGFPWSRQEEADFTLLCVVWLQCSFGIKHSLLLRCVPGQIRLCPVAQLHCGAGSLSLQSLELPLAFPPKICSFTQQIFTSVLPYPGLCG